MRLPWLGESREIPGCLMTQRTPSMTGKRDKWGGDGACTHGSLLPSMFLNGYCFVLYGVACAGSGRDLERRLSGPEATACTCSCSAEWGLAYLVEAYAWEEQR